MIKSVRSAYALLCDDLGRNGAEAQLSQLVTQDFENRCALDDALQRICSGAAAKCNDIFNRDQRRFCVNRRWFGLFLCRFFDFGRVLVHR